MILIALLIILKHMIMDLIVYMVQKKATDFSCCTLGGMGVRMGVEGGGGSYRREATLLI